MIENERTEKMKEDKIRYQEFIRRIDNIMTNLHPREAKIQHEWIEKHQKADLIIDDKGQPSIAVYVNPIWRISKNTENLFKAIHHAIEYYENEM